MASAYARPSRRGGACGLARRLQHDLSARRIHRGRASRPPTDKQEFRAACIDTITASYFRHGAIGSAPAYRGLSAGMHPAAALAARGRSAEDPGVVAAAFVPVALGLLALILMVAAVQTVGAVILPGCLGYRGLSRAAVLKVRIHLPPAKSRANSGTDVEAARSNVVDRILKGAKPAAVPVRDHRQPCLPHPRHRSRSSSRRP